MPVQGSQLKDFIIKALQEKRYENFTSLPDGESFQLICPKKNNKKFKKEYEQIFKDWDKLRGREPDSSSKGRFLTALKASYFITVTEQKKSVFIMKFNNSNEIVAAKAKKNLKSIKNISNHGSDSESLERPPRSSTEPVTSPQLAPMPTAAENISSCNSVNICNKEPNFPPSRCSSLSKGQGTISTSIFAPSRIMVSETSSEPEAHCDSVGSNSANKPKGETGNVWRELRNATVDTRHKCVDSYGCLSETLPCESSSLQTPTHYQSSGASSDSSNIQLSAQLFENNISFSCPEDYRSNESQTSEEMLGFSNSLYSTSSVNRESAKAPNIPLSEEEFQEELQGRACDKSCQTTENLIDDMGNCLPQKQVDTGCEMNQELEQPKVKKAKLSQVGICNSVSESKNHQCEETRTGAQQFASAEPRITCLEASASHSYNNPRLTSSTTGLVPSLVTAQGPAGSIYSELTLTDSENETQVNCETVQQIVNIPAFSAFTESELLKKYEKLIKESEDIERQRIEIDRKSKDNELQRIEIDRKSKDNELQRIEIDRKSKDNELQRIEIDRKLKDNEQQRIEIEGKKSATLSEMTKFLMNRTMQRL